ncbi:MAG TPA: hypothetical protein VLT33_45035, partial [Labilithrix sp.]|nr:hypothetical protein [Labilithrix sp.]
MELLERRVYRGPSLYAHFPVMRLTVDLGALEQWPSAKIPGFNEGLLAAIPSLGAHKCSFDAEGGFVRRLQEDGGTWLGHVLEHVAIELQQLTGANTVFGKTRSAGAPGQYHVVFEYEEERVGEAASNLALKLIHHLLPPDLRPKEAKTEADGGTAPAFDFAA